MFVGVWIREHQLAVVVSRSGANRLPTVRVANGFSCFDGINPAGNPAAGNLDLAVADIGNAAHRWRGRRGELSQHDVVSIATVVSDLKRLRLTKDEHGVVS